MALIFELTALCSDVRERDAFVRHIDAFEHPLVTTGRTVRWRAEAYTQYSPLVALGHSPDLSNKGIRTVDDALEITECGLRIYNHLRFAPAFRFAIAGWDSGGNPPEDVLEDLADDTDMAGRRWPPYVVDAALFAQIGEPASWVPFREGYWWSPYRGEPYRPLGSNDHPELSTLQRELFPELFRQ